MKKTGFPAYLPALPHDRCTGISGYFAKTMFRHEKRLYKNMRRHQPYLAMLITMERYSGNHSVTDNAVPQIQSESRAPPKSIRFPGDQTEKQPYTVFSGEKDSRIRTRFVSELSGLYLRTGYRYRKKRQNRVVPRQETRDSDLPDTTCRLARFTATRSAKVAVCLTVP